MRPSPLSPPASTQRKKQHFEDRQYRFLTYVFGGGVKVQEADAVTPVRVASVRGQLRFWWRACNPSKCTTVEELRQREGEIWGTTSQASRVEITVVSQPKAPREVTVFEYNTTKPSKPLVVCKGMGEIAYGAFPLQPSKETQPLAKPGKLFDYQGSLFTLRFVYPEDLHEDVQAALWGWETFGGLGGRTRRGFGAITHVNGQGMSAEAGLSRYSEYPRIPGVPSLHRARFGAAPGTVGDALQAWKDGLGLLKKLRQEAGHGRNPSQDPYKPAGRSRWPEPNAIRHLTKKEAARHEPPTAPIERFPRAVFGMPIIFHFSTKGDPDMKLQLLPVGKERLASPLIIRPIPEGNRFRTAALVLSSDIPEVTLVADKEPHFVDWRLDPTQARDIPALVRNGNVFTDPLELFLSELKK